MSVRGDVIGRIKGRFGIVTLRLLEKMDRRLRIGDDRFQESDFLRVRRFLDSEL